MTRAAIAYSEDTRQAEARERAHTYHAPVGNQAERYETIRQEAGELARLFNEMCPPSRELSVAHTQLETAVMWANAAIARNDIGMSGVDGQIDKEAACDD